MPIVDVVEFIPDPELITEFWIQKTGEDEYNIGVDSAELDSFAYLTVTRAELYDIYVQLRDFLGRE